MKRHQTRREKSVIVWSIPSLWGEEEILGAAPGSRDAWCRFWNAKLSTCVPENPVVVLLFFLPVMVYKAIKDTRLLLDSVRTHGPPLQKCV